MRRDKTEVGDEGSAAGDPSEKSDEQLTLEQEAAQAIIRGEQTTQVAPAVESHLLCGQTGDEVALAIKDSWPCVRTALDDVMMACMEVGIMLSVLLPRVTATEV